MSLNRKVKVPRVSGPDSVIRGAPGRRSGPVGFGQVTLDDARTSADVLKATVKQDQASLRSILDDVQEDLKKIETQVSAEDRQLLREHAALVRELEQELESDDIQVSDHAEPELEPGVTEDNELVTFQRRARKPS